MTKKADLRQPYRLLDHKEIYRGKLIDLVVDTIEIEEAPYVREVVRHPGGVVVLAELEEGLIPFVRQHRYPMNRKLLELPAGKIDSGEAPAAAAAREFEEETGWRPLSITHVCSFYSTPGFCDELLHLFYTDEVRRTSSRLEPDEDVNVELYTFDQTMELVARGEIPDAKSLVALFWLQSVRRKREDDG